MIDNIRNLYSCDGAKNSDLKSDLHDTITIFIPTYKNEHLVLGCVKSCLDQSYQNIIVIVVDNGFGETGDSLWKQLTKFKDKRLFYHPNTTNIELQGNFHLILSLAQNVNRFMVIPADMFLAVDCIKKMVDTYKADPSVTLIFGRTMSRDIKNYQVTADIDLGGELVVWPFNSSSTLDSTVLISHFFNKNNINSELSHFSFIGSLMDGGLIRSIGLSRIPLFYHGWEEYISLIVLSYSKNVAIINEPLYILYTNNERLGWAARPKFNYTRYEPIYTEYSYLKEYEPLLIKRGLSLSKLNCALLFKTIYTMLRYPGAIYFLLPTFLSFFLRTIFILLPVELYLLIKSKLD